MKKETETITAISDLMRRYDQVYSRWSDVRGFSANAMALMEELYIRPEGMEPAVLADFLGVPRQTMTSTLDGLERRGIIERLPHKTDRRRKIIKFTEEGRAEASLLVGELHEWMLSALLPVNEEELDRTMKVVSGFCLRLEKGTPRFTPAKHSD